MLTAPRSPRVKALHALSRRVVRVREGRFLAEGPQAVREALAEHARRLGAGDVPLVHEVLVDEDAARRHPDLVAAAQASRVLVTEASAAVLAAISDTVTPQGVVALCSLITSPLGSLPVPAAAPSPPPLVAALAHVRDPGNAGTIVRTADAAGASAVVLSSDSVDPHNAKCVRASAGSVFHLPVAVGGDPGELVLDLRSRGLVVLAADGHPGGADLDDLLDAAEHGQGPLTGPTAWLFGNEAHGLAEPVRALADLVVRIPIHGQAESLNLAGAAAICLYASARARRVRPVVAGATNQLTGGARDAG